MVNKVYLALSGNTVVVIVVIVNVVVNVNIVVVALFVVTDKILFSCCQQMLI